MNDSDRSQSIADAIRDELMAEEVEYEREYDDSTRRKVAINNLYAFLSIAIVAIGTLAIVAIHELLFGAFSMGIHPDSYNWVIPFAGIPLFATYVLLGYALLTPLPRRNFRSVSWPVIALFALSVVGQIGFPLALIWLVNLPALAVVLYAVGSGAEAATWQIFLSGIIATFIPSLSMYAGLRLKIWRENKQKSGKESTHEQRNF